jgi:geranylgeranyl pyrophosphate synthase
VLAARPTLLLALALEAAATEDREWLLELMAQPERTPADLRRIRRLFDDCDVIGKAEQLVQKYRERTESVADEVEPVALREMLYFLVDTVLDNAPAETAPVVEPLLPVVAVS